MPLRVRVMTLRADASIGTELCQANFFLLEESLAWGPGCGLQRCQSPYSFDMGAAIAWNFQTGPLFHCPTGPNPLRTAQQNNTAEQRFPCSSLFGGLDSTSETALGAGFVGLQEPLVPSDG